MACDKCKQITEAFDNCIAAEKNNALYFKLKNDLIEKRKAFIMLDRSKEHVNSAIIELKKQIKELQQINSENEASMERLITDIDVLEKEYHAVRYKDTTDIMHGLEKLRQTI